MDNMVAEIKRTDYRLRHLVMIAEQAVEGIAVVDLKGILWFANTAWARMHRYESGNELIGKPISQFHTDGQMKADVFPFIEEAGRRGQLEGPVEHIRRDGMVFPTQTKMTAVRDETGRTIGLVLFVTDVSESKRTEELLKQRAAELKIANERLLSQISERKRMENQLREYRNRLEQQIAELMTANTELQRQVAEHERVESELQEYVDGIEQQIAELVAAVNKVVQFSASAPRVFCRKTR
jgi:PAS domain S-box-containing protein